MKTKVISKRIRFRLYKTIILFLEDKIIINRDDSNYLLLRKLNKNGFCYALQITASYLGLDIYNIYTTRGRYYDIKQYPELLKYCPDPDSPDCGYWGLTMQSEGVTRRLNILKEIIANNKTK